jgi:hypothetical protein
MRKLAPVLITSIAALFGGTALAATGATNSASPDKVTGSPSVEPNTSNPQGLSYSDKNNMSPGTNAQMDPSATDDKTTTATTAKTRKHKAKVAKAGDPNTANRPPIDSTNGAAVNSTTGTSPGGT